MRKPSNILDESNGYPEIFLAFLLGNICSFEQLFYRKKSLGAPEIITAALRKRWCKNNKICE